MASGFAARHIIEDGSKPYYTRRYYMSSAESEPVHSTVLALFYVSPLSQTKEFSLRSLMENK